MQQTISRKTNQMVRRLAHFDISVQHIAGSNLKFTDFLSRNPVEGATIENMYDEEYVINIFTEQAELNSKYGRIFTNQSQQTPNNKTMREHKLNNQSEANRTFEKKRHVNKINEQAETSPNNNAIKFKPQKEKRITITQFPNFTNTVSRRNGPGLFSLGSDN